MKARMEAHLEKDLKDMEAGMDKLEKILILEIGVLNKLFCRLLLMMGLSEGDIEIIFSLIVLRKLGLHVDGILAIIYLV